LPRDITFFPVAETAIRDIFWNSRPGLK
jgi:hypothetical protein